MESWKLQEQVIQVTKCPFGGAASNLSSSATRCPFSGATSAAKPTAAATEGAGKCPSAFGVRNPENLAHAVLAPEAPVCPMGFGTAKKPKTVESALICSRCDALFFDSVKMDCQHYFCRACIEPCSDCLMCGADIHKRTPEPKLEDLVELFIKVCGDLDAFEAAAAGRAAADSKATGTDDDSNAATRDKGNDGGAEQHGSEATSKSSNAKDDVARAEYMLQCALRSMAGGNFAAAAARFGRCREQLVSLAEAAAETSWSEDSCCRLGDVCGSQGVCEQRLGRLNAAEGCFKDSIHFLKKSPVRSGQVVHALAVSNNKLGDLHYSRQEHELARSSYSDALAIRQQAYDVQAQDDDGCAHVSAALNLVTSLLKVADIEEVLGNSKAASECLAKADNLLVSVSGNILPGSADEAKHRGLQDFSMKLGATLNANIDDLKVS